MIDIFIKNEIGYIQEVKIGDYIVVISPLKGDYNKKTQIGGEHRFAHVLAITDENKIHIQMYTTKDKQKTAVALNINGEKRLIKFDLNISISKTQILNVKKSNKISLNQIQEINKAADQQNKNFSQSKIKKKKSS